jgi:hypothetical protein
MRLAIEKTPRLLPKPKFHILLTKARQCILSCATLIHSTPIHPFSLIAISIQPSHLCVGLLTGLFPFDFGSKFLMYTCYMSHPSHLLIIIIITMARQPCMGLGLLFPRLLGLVHLWLTGRAVLLNLAASQETWVRNGRWILLTSITVLFMPVRFFYMP